MATSSTAGERPAEIAADEHLTTRVWERADAVPGRPILTHHADGAWRTVTWSGLAQRVRAVAAGLIALGVEPGDRVALMAGTSLEWTVTDLAILAVGGVTVPIYETSSVDQCAWILSDSAAILAIAGEREHAGRLEGARDRAPELGEVFIVAEGGLDAVAARAEVAHAQQVAERCTALGSDDLATLIYTSGTTGNPKGCELTHGNLLFAARQGERSLRLVLAGDDDATLLFLPLAHVFARMVQFLCLEADTGLMFSRGIEHLQDDLAATTPTFLLSVPRVFEKVFNGAQRKAEGRKAKVFAMAVAAGQDWSRADTAGRNPGLGTRLRKAVADRLVYGKLRDALGGKVRNCVSGGAPLAPHLAHFFHAAGITILEGYGLTETSAPATVNTPEHLRIGTVGRPLAGVEIAIADDGEILIRGGNVFRGYFGNPEATAEAFTEDGWFRSGDLGDVDGDGYLSITGRKKEILVTASGKNVAPAVLEERLKAHRLISQAMVVGDDRPFIGALVTLEPDELAAFAKERGLSGDPAELSQSAAIQQEVGRAVEHANAAVSRAESIRKVVVLERDFTEDRDEITPTLKLRRQVVAEHFADEIDGLYTG